MKTANKKWMLAGGIGLILFLLFYGLSQCEQKKVYTWRDSYSNRVEHPFGSYLVYQQLEDLFTDDSIEVIKQNLFDQLVYEFQTGINYILINNYTPFFEEDWIELKEFVERGNNVFISGTNFSDLMTDSMGIAFMIGFAEDRDSISIQFSSAMGKGKWYDFPQNGMAFIILPEDSLNFNQVEVLAETREGGIVFIRKRIGNGWLYICSCPRIFTNYYMVHSENHEVISRMFSFLPEDKEIWWDEFYKPGNLRMYSRIEDFSGQENKSRDKLDFIFEHESLSWAFWLTILGLLLYALFEGKRKQRLIPIIKPLPNMTLDFTETIGRLYFQSKNHKNIAEKRIRTLFAYIREHYYLKTDVVDETFLNSLSAKSGIPLGDIQQLFSLIRQVRESEQLTETKLIELSIQIDHFYRKGSR